MAESNTFTGVVSGGDVNWRSSYGALTSKQLYTIGYSWAAFTATPFLKVLGINAFGAASLQNSKNFGHAMMASMQGGQKGKPIQFHSGKRAIQGTVFATTGTSNHVGRLGSFNPELVEGGTPWVYSWHRLIAARYIPDVDVQDNGPDSYIDIKAQKMDELQQTIVRDFSYCVLGSGSAPDTGVMGPSSVYADLPNLISVTQDQTVGGIATSTNSFWQNASKLFTDIGGGGELDRPLQLRRSMINGMHDVKANAETMNSMYLLLATQGAYEFYQRLAYADAVQAGASATFGLSETYDTCGVDHLVFEKNPMIWDPNCTIPYGASASTNAVYGISLGDFAISLRKEEAFLQTPWEAPREHDLQRTLVAQNRTRYTPMVTNRRSHIVFYDLPANSD